MAWIETSWTHLHAAVAQVQVHRGGIVGHLVLSVKTNFAIIFKKREKIEGEDRGVWYGKAQKTVDDLGESMSMQIARAISTGPSTALYTRTVQALDMVAIPSPRCKSLPEYPFWEEEGV